MLTGIVKTMVLAGLLATVSAPLTTSAKGTAGAAPFQIKMSGATEIVQPEPKDGILSGGYCLPDIHLFDKSEIVNTPFGQAPNHMVFAVHVTAQSNSPKASPINLKDTNVEVLIYASGGDLVATVPMPLSPVKDPNTGTDFFVQCIFLDGPNKTDLPTGEYSYKFKATVKNAQGDTKQRQWVPSNNKFTIVDSSQK